MGNCFASFVKKKDESGYECILYPLTLERKIRTRYGQSLKRRPEIKTRVDSLPKDEAGTLARIYSLYLDHELQSINEELSSDSNDAWNNSVTLTKRSRSKSQDTLICNLTSCQMQISNIFKCSSIYCEKHTNCRNCGEKVINGIDFVVVSGFIYCKRHVRQYNTL